MPPSVRQPRQAPRGEGATPLPPISRPVPLTNPEAERGTPPPTPIPELSPPVVPTPVLPQQRPYDGQKSCPVTGQALGSHGTPIPVTVRGETIYVCCQGCVDSVRNDFDTYLRKVKVERKRP